jgi:hypothetical protein
MRPILIETEAWPSIPDNPDSVDHELAGHPAFPWQPIIILLVYIPIMYCSNS